MAGLDIEETRHLEYVLARTKVHAFEYVHNMDIRSELEFLFRGAERQLIDHIEAVENGGYNGGTLGRACYWVQHMIIYIECSGSIDPYHKGYLVGKLSAILDVLTLGDVESRTEEG